MKLANHLIASATLVLLLWSCKEKEKAIGVNQQEALPIKTIQSPTKPGSSFTDTIKIKGAAAIFYYPDSLQDAKIKSITAANIYNSSVHEMFYQMRNAKMVIKKDYPNLKMVEVTKSRFIQIQKKDGGIQLIDLDKYNDARGLIMVNGLKEPQLTDMTNIDTELYRYFKEAQ